LLQLEQTNRDLIEEIESQREEAEFKATILRSGANVDTRLAGDINRAGNFNAIGTGLAGLGNILRIKGV